MNLLLLSRSQWRGKRAKLLTWPNTLGDLLLPKHPKISLFPEILVVLRLEMRRMLVVLPSSCCFNPFAVGLKEGSGSQLGSNRSDFAEWIWHAGIQTQLCKCFLFRPSLTLSQRGISLPPKQAPARLQRIKPLIYSLQAQLGTQIPGEAYLALYTSRQNSNTFGFQAVENLYFACFVRITIRIKCISIQEGLDSTKVFLAKNTFTP